jgi:hypothetical protein
MLLLCVFCCWRTEVKSSHNNSGVHSRCPLAEPTTAQHSPHWVAYCNMVKCCCGGLHNSQGLLQHQFTSISWLPITALYCTVHLQNSFKNNVTMYYDRAQAHGKSITITPPSTKDPVRLLKATHHVCSLLEGRGGSFPSGPARPSRVLLVYNAGPARQAYRGRSSKVTRHGLSLLALFTWRALCDEPRRSADPYSSVCCWHPSSISSPLHGEIS